MTNKKIIVYFQFQITLFKFKWLLYFKFKGWYINQAKSSDFVSGNQNNLRDISTKKWYHYIIGLQTDTQILYNREQTNKKQ